MHQASIADFTTPLTERHSVKKYDASAVMTKEQIEELIGLAQKAPSAWNLQPWKFLVIHEEAQKQKLLPIAYGQKQVLDASITVAILGDLQADQNAEPVYSQAVKDGFLNEEIKERLVGQIHNAYQDPGTARDQAFLNASLAAMQLMLAAKTAGYDSCPMGGFDAERFVREFHIPDRYVPIMLLAIGKAAEPAYPSKRFAVNDVIVWNQF